MQLLFIKFFALAVVNLNLKKMILLFFVAMNIIMLSNALIVVKFLKSLERIE